MSWTMFALGFLDGMIAAAIARIWLTIKQGYRTMTYDQALAYAETNYPGFRSLDQCGPCYWEVTCSEGRLHHFGPEELAAQDGSQSGGNGV